MEGRSNEEVEAGDTCLTRDKEIPKWHRTPYPMTTISEGNQRDYARNRGRSSFLNHCGDGPTRGRRGLFDRPVRTSEPVHYSHKVCNNNA